MSHKADRAYKARQLRYRRAALTMLQRDSIDDELYNIANECAELEWVIGDDDTLYLISTDYGYSSPSLSTVYALKQDNPGSSPVPEPTSGLLFFSGLSIFLCWRNRCRSQAPDFLP